MCIRDSAGIPREVALHVLLRGAALYAELAREPERRHAIDQAEIDYLRIAALFTAHLGRRHAEDFRGCRAMYVLAGSEGLHQARVLRDMGHDAELHLRIIGGDDSGPGRSDESLADTPAFGRANGDVLEIRVVAGKTPGHRHRLPVGRVNAPRRG